MIAASVVEVFTLAGALPFLAVLANPEPIWRNPVVEKLVPQLKTDSLGKLLLQVTLFFLLVISLQRFSS
jgi:hypothetical protein